MSAIKSRREHQIILDFSDNKITKSFIQQALRTTRFSQFYYQSGSVGLVFIDHEIKIGNYIIELVLDRCNNASMLRDYGRFSVNIWETINDELKMKINLMRDNKFKITSWAELADKNRLNMGHLTQIILHCKRLSRLKCYF